MNPLVSVNRPIVIKRGWEGEVESNTVNAYFGEWAVFKFPLADNVFAEMRLPIDEAREESLVIATDQITFSPEDWDEGENEEDDLGDSN